LKCHLDPLITHEPKNTRYFSASLDAITETGIGYRLMAATDAASE
jgi:hypothetical protein